jgi:hypothetical protein
MPGGKPIHEKRDFQTENVFNMVVQRAEEKGMKVNVNKTQMILISDAISFTPHAFIQPSNGGRVEASGGELKLLGYTFDDTPTARAHVKATINKARRRLWILRHLAKFGFDQEELVQVYKSQIRSVVEYCSVVYHSLLTGEQAQALESFQYQALKCIFGVGESYRSLREKSQLELLSERRLSAVDKFTVKCLARDFKHWFPLNTSTRVTRKREVYREEYARCDRLRHTPIFFMRRRLNEKNRSEQ